MLNYIKITDSSGISDNNDGTYTVHFIDGTSRLVTDAEIIMALKSAKIIELKIATSTAINSGFMSSALGAPYRYDSTLPQDQINLLGAVLSGMDVNYTCTASSGVKSQVMHTAAQLQQVFKDGAGWIEFNKANFWSKAAAVNSATTVDEVNAVVF